MPDKAPENPERYDDDARSSDGSASAAGVTQSRQADDDVSRAPDATDDSASRDSQGGAHAAEKPRKNPVLVWVKEIVTVVAIALVLSFLLKTFLFRAFYIPSESMESTLDVNDRIFINLLVPGPFDLQRGDVVVFKDTQAWLPPVAPKPAGPMDWVGDGLEFVGLAPDDNEQHLVKRIIGLPGDRVSCCDAQGHLSINGKPVNETYINPAEVPFPKPFDIVVPEGKVWVMGDNRNHSEDSRAHQEVNGGFVNIEDVEGKATVIAWPVNRWTILDNYPDVFRDVPKGTSGN
ncbi:signal peptidase I [Arthrobacter sp. yr096]|uniref:signal peptidase I n=1 Tax=unclassified Arthrobacter TaxID=235627 RepID=UPI0008982466|nr:MULTISPECIES: signal peptidase I [unclassified Arthrobacter]SDW39515.1 signal peptidase I [Arthrobacter sp. cf158]SEI58530.1 signal peptidase I [Arthrobacter sp. yr096]